MKQLFLLFILFFAYNLAIGQGKSITRIAFGSCSKDEEPQLWKEVMQQNPHLWIWLGDNIYGDSQDPAILRLKYNRQKANPDYQKLLKLMPVIGTWDDHDYGVNDGGKFNSKKKEAKDPLLEFLDVPSDAAVRKHDGVYSSYTFGVPPKQIKIILLDTRYFRDTLEASKLEGRRYNINETGDVLGEEQWTWLEKELTNSVAQVHIIGSSIQLIADEQGFEKWGNFPKARKRFFDLIKKSLPNNAFIISGDRHIAEISKIELKGVPYQLYDFTSSGLTHTWANDFGEINTHRVGKNVIKRNFGLILVDWSKRSPTIKFEVWGDEASPLLTHVAFE